MSLRERIKQISDEPKPKLKADRPSGNKYVSLKDGELKTITISDTGTSTWQVELIKCVYCGEMYYNNYNNTDNKVKYCPHCGVITKEAYDT